MENLTGWDMAVLAVAVYLSITALVRLMRARRDVLIRDLRQQVSEQQARKRAAERKARKKGQEKRAQWSG